MLVLAMQLSTIGCRRSWRRRGGRRAHHALEPEPPRAGRDTRTPRFGVRVPAFPQSGTEDGPSTSSSIGEAVKPTTWSSDDGRPIGGQLGVSLSPPTGVGDDRYG